jgi:hypothetical protein
VHTVTAADGIEGGARARFIVESERDTDLREGLAAMVVQAGWGLLELEPLEPTLEDIFLHLTAQARAAAAAGTPSVERLAERKEAPEAVAP